MQYYLAIDNLESGGRHVLGHVDDGRIVLDELCRFDITPVNKNGRLCWDIDSMFSRIIKSLSRCKEIGKIPVSMGIETWGNDFVLLDENDELIGDIVSYRDRRTTGVDEILEAKVSADELYMRTGIQKQLFNTIYQLAAVKRDTPEHLEKAASLLMIPDYINYMLTGVKMNEYTNATTTGLIGVYDKTWDTELLDILGYPRRIFGTLHTPADTVGELTEEIQRQVGFNCTVTLPATHDTASSFVAVPATDTDSIYLSSGSWSLLGVENMWPSICEESQYQNFTNEGGYEYRYRLLKNIKGMWMLDSVMRDLGQKYTYQQMVDIARNTPKFPSKVDVNANCFLAPDSMIQAVKQYCKKTGQIVPQSVGEVLHCIYTGISECYAKTIKALEELTFTTYRCIHIVGTGSRDEYLNELTADVTGLPVFAGPVESMSLGNLIVQMIKYGEFSDLASARQAIRDSFEIREIRPGRRK